MEIQTDTTHPHNTKPEKKSLIQPIFPICLSVCLSDCLFFPLPPKNLPISLDKFVITCPYFSTSGIRRKKRRILHIIYQPFSLRWENPRSSESPKEEFRFPVDCPPVSPPNLMKSVRDIIMIQRFFLATAETILLPPVRGGVTYSSIPAKNAPLLLASYLLSQSLPFCPNRDKRHSDLDMDGIFTVIRSASLSFFFILSLRPTKKSRNPVINNTTKNNIQASVSLPPPPFFTWINFY